MEYILTLQSGNRRGMTWRIGEKGLLIGRGEDCDVVVPGLAVSRRHCALQANDGAVMMEDLGSRNPTLLNGAVQRTAKLAPGDELRVGDALFLVGAVQGVDTPGNGSVVERDSVTVELRGRDLFAQELTSQVTPWPGTLNDYALLFRYARDLSRISAFRTLEKTICDLARRRFAATGCWLSPSTSDDHVSWPWPVSLPSFAPEVGAAIDGASRASRASIVEMGAAGNPQQYFVAPARNGQHCEGIVIVKTTLHDKSQMNDHLMVFAAMADLTGPALASVLRNERSRVLQRKRDKLSLGDPPILGQSAVMELFRRQLREAAAVSAHVFLLGETGTGKELAARNIHHYGAHAAGPFVTVNGAAPLPGFPEAAFRERLSDEAKILPSALGGTLFIDNIDRLTESIQARLAAQLDELPTAAWGQGGTAWLRIIASAASRERIHGLLPELFHRLSGLWVITPSLADHAEDIPELAQYFLESLQLIHPHLTCRWGVDALEALQKRPWPGNVRELRNVVERLAHQYLSGVIPASAVPPGEGQPGAAHTLTRGKPQPMAEVERAYIEYALEYCNQNVSQAAKLLGMSRSTLYQKVKPRE